MDPPVYISTEFDANTYVLSHPRGLHANSYTVSPNPQDLRLFHQPLHTRLSPASAGLPGDDAADITLIREAWVRSEAREISRKGRRRIRYADHAYPVALHPTHLVFA